MRLDRRATISWIALLCLTLLVTRIAGTHLHLCFDGMEPPVAFHTLDAQAHHAVGAGHADQDVELPSATLAKALQQFGTASFLFVALSSLILAVAAQRFTFHWRTPARRFTSLLLLRPPLRGPPLLLPR